MIAIDEIINGDVLWQMSYPERMSILYLLDKMPKRKVAIEIGTYKGGFLKTLAKRFEKVYSLDIDHDNCHIKDQLDNVIWIEGDSRYTLPHLFEELNHNDEIVNFILVDGDHEFDGALRDINNVLTYQPKDDVVIAMHDSWYAPTRNAINNANWNISPYIHFVEKDFVPGDVVRINDKYAFVGGLALALMSPNERIEGGVNINQTYDYMYRVCTQLFEKEGEIT